MERHSPAAAPVRPGLSRHGGAHRVVRVRHPADPHHAPAADRDPDQALARVAASVGDWSGGTRIGARSGRSTSAGLAASCARGGSCWCVRMAGTGAIPPGGRGDRPAPAKLPPPDLAQSAGRRGRLPAPGGRHGRRLAPHRRVPAGRGGVARAAGETWAASGGARGRRRAHAALPERSPGQPTTSIIGGGVHRDRTGTTLR